MCTVYLCICCNNVSFVKTVCLQGEHIGTTEATEAFFAMTKLFQSKDVSELNWHGHFLHVIQHCFSQLNQQQFLLLIQTKRNFQHTSLSVVGLFDNVSRHTQIIVPGKLPATVSVLQLCLSVLQLCLC